MNTLALRAAVLAIAVVTPAVFAAPPADGHDDHAGHDHGTPPKTAKPDAHAGHDHGPPAKTAKPDDHAGHDHGKPDAHAGHADEVVLTEAAIKAHGIVIGRAEKRDLRATVVAPARVAFDAEAMAHVGSVVSGRVIAIKARVGETVKKGDALLTIESPELGRSQTEYLQRRTDAEVAAAAVAPTQQAFDRAKKLFEESQGIPIAELQKVDAERRVAAGLAVTSRAAVQAAEQSLRLFGFDDARIKRLADAGEIDATLNVLAPIDGRVIEREVTLGELVSPDKDKLLVIADTSSAWVLADVPEAKLADIGVGSVAEVFLAARPGAAVRGEVSFVSAELDPTTRTATLRIVVPNADAALRPGMFARAVLQAHAAGVGVVAVPEEAVLTVEGSPGVFVPVAGEPNTFARRGVKVGPATNGFVPITEGLAADEAVVVRGAFVLKAELGKSEAGHQH